MKPTRVLLADDHTLVRAGLRKLLESMPEVTVVGEADDGLALLTLAAELRIESAVGQGSRLRLRCPLNARGAPQ